MPCSSTIEEALDLASLRWPGITFRIKNSEEACGPCPICTQAHNDGFLVFSSGFYFCRPGGHQGWLDEHLPVDLTAEQRALRQVIAEQARAKRERQRIKERLSALERLNQCTDHLTYHRALDENDRAWWHAQGIVDASIEAYELGVCYGCPMDYPDHRPSYTIPIYTSREDKLLNIRHRLIGEVDGSRYRPHMQGLPGKALFNSRFAITENECLLVEGEKKSIVLEQYGYPAMGTLGKYGFNLAWLPKFKARELTLCPDPDGVELWCKLGEQIAKEGLKVNLCVLPSKPDDIFINGGSRSDFEHYLRLSRRIH